MYDRLTHPLQGGGVSQQGSVPLGRPFTNGVVYAFLRVGVLRYRVTEGLLRFKRDEQPSRHLSPYAGLLEEPLQGLGSSHKRRKICPQPFKVPPLPPPAGCGTLLPCQLLDTWGSNCWTCGVSVQWGRMGRRKSALRALQVPRIEGTSGLVLREWGEGREEERSACSTSTGGLRERGEEDRSACNARTEA